MFICDMQVEGVFVHVYDSVRRFTHAASSSPLLIEVLTPEAERVQESLLGDMRSIIFWHVCTYLHSLSLLFGVNA